MTIWRELFGSQPSGLDRVRAHLLDMLEIDRRTFDIATHALLTGADPDAARRAASASDHQVNELVQQVRRELVVHASTRGDMGDLPAELLYMSIVKDIERIGDYAKNILDIARAGGDLSSGDDHDDLVSYQSRVSSLVSEVRRVFEAQDADEATRILTAWGEVSRSLDRLVDALVTADTTAAHAVPRALYYRYVKRIIGHLMNILTALVMPLDKLDFFWGEDREADA